MIKVGEKKSVTILIVDDKPANIFSLEKLLEKKDRILLRATNGTEALKLAHSREVDLIILDVQMPDMDGFEVAQILKSNKRTRDIPIIFASAEKKEHASMMKGYDEGAIDYLFKPLDPELTRAKVSVLLKIQLQKKELLEKNISLEKSALLINNSADIIGIIDPATLKFEEVNQAFENILGYPTEEAKGTSLSFFLHAEDRPLFQKMVGTKEGKISFETRVYCRDRTIKWLHWHVVIRHDKWFINARDITELKEGEKIKNYVAAIVKQSSEAVYIHDQEGRIISWNEGAELIYGYTESEALNMKIWNIIPEFILKQTQQTVDQIVQGEKINSQETKRITKRGKIIDVLFSASVLLDSSDKHKSIAITERDITTQKIADKKIAQLNSELQHNIEQLEATNKELESFSYSVSHDLRAPLRAIHGNAKIIEEDMPEMDEAIRASLIKIQNNAQRMGMLIDDLLSFSRINKHEILRSETNMEDIVRKSIAEISDVVPHHADISVTALPPALADRSLISQVWFNLISNAIKYSSKKDCPRIEIGADIKKEDVTYFIRDNGAGFDMNYANKLFGAFQRLHHDTEFEGTGIGLAIVNRIITRHNGRVWAESKVGDGATFYFSIPSATSFPLTNSNP
ncbi:MAG: hybrid sensor histidine kinase/response regulator [Bacteroidota bacterium]